MAGQPLRVLALVARFKWIHIDYLHALADRFDLVAAHAGEGHEGAVGRARREGLPLVTLPVAGEGVAEVAPEALRELLEESRPDVVHSLYYYNELLTPLARSISPSPIVVHECRDPLTTLRPSDESALLERRALEASDGQIFVSAALRSYLQQRHGLELESTSIVVPQGFAFRTLAPPSPKLSAQDGETHLALVGTAFDDPDRGRYYVDIIERLTGMGFVVHSHFHELSPGGNRIYEELARSNPRYRYHVAVGFRGDQLSPLMSRYDLMGVFHELEAPEGNEAATLAVCLPTKAVCGWFHGGIPVVCLRHYGGVVERIEQHGSGFVLDGWEDLERLRTDRAAIADATTRTLAIREQFSNEWNAARIEGLFRQLGAARDRRVSTVAAP